MKKLLAITLGVALAGVGTVALAGRNSAGTYSLPAGNPVVSGTSISSSWANNTLGDLATEITASLDRNGKGGMLAPLRTTDGTVAAPTHSFTSETGSGLYRAGASDVRMSIAGTDRAKWTAGGIFADVWTALTATSATIKGAVADGASAVGVIIDNTIALATSGAKLVSFRSNGVEKASIDKDGKVTAAGGADITGTVGITGTLSVSSVIDATQIEITSATALIDFKDVLSEDTDARIIKATGSNLAVTGTPLTVMTPVADTDAATKAYVDTPATGSVSGLHASLPSAPGVAKLGGRAWFTGATITATGSLVDAADNFLDGAASILFTIPAGFRPAADVYVPVTFFNTKAGGTDRMVTAYLKINTGGVVRMHVRGYAGGDFSVLNGDQITFAATLAWPL